MKKIILLIALTGVAVLGLMAMSTQSEDEVLPNRYILQVTPEFEVNDLDALDIEQAQVIFDVEDELMYLVVAKEGSGDIFTQLEAIKGVEFVEYDREITIDPQ